MVSNAMAKIVVDYEEKPFFMIIPIPVATSGC